VSDEDLSEIRWSDVRIEKFKRRSPMAGQLAIRLARVRNGRRRCGRPGEDIFQTPSFLAP
jgi:hypothetical protein